MRATGLAADSGVQKHDPGPGHPEQPARYSAVLNRLETSGLLRDLVRLETRSASDDELALAHTPHYISLVEREVAANRGQLSTGDTAINRHSAKAARLAAGCAIAAVDEVFSGAVRNGFCVDRKSVV